MLLKMFVFFFFKCEALLTMGLFFFFPALLKERGREEGRKEEGRETEASLKQNLGVPFQHTILV